MAEALSSVTRVDGLGMITVRADLGRSGDAIAQAAGLAIPETTRIVTDGKRSLGWMSPDELLLILPIAEVMQTRADLEQALLGEHALVVDVSDMRVVFDLAGSKAEQALMKLCPVDFSSFPKDGLRRTRAAQAAVAIWRQGRGFRVIGMRSTADYLDLILQNAAMPGSDLDPR